MKIPDYYDQDSDLHKVKRLLDDLGVGYDYEVVMGRAFLSCAMQHDKVKAYVGFEAGFNFDLSGKFIHLYIAE